MKKCLLTIILLFSCVSAGHVFEFLPYTSIRGSLYLTDTKMNGKHISTMVPSYASTVGMHFGRSFRGEFEYNSHAMAGNQVPMSISGDDVYMSVKIDTYMLNFYYDFVSKKDHAFFVGVGGGAANTVFYMPYVNDPSADHNGVEGYLCATYSAIAGMNFKVLRRVYIETFLIYNSVVAPFEGINNINSFGVGVGVRFDTLTDD